MSLYSVHVFLYIGIALTVCQGTRSFSIHDGKGDPVVWKISGGAYAKEAQFPYVAAVHRLVGDGKTMQCGGTVLSKRWVLTAGHCIANTPRRFYVIFGITDKSGVGYDSNQGPGVAMITTRAVLHPQYNIVVNDIGLLNMPRDIPFSRTIRPIILPGSIYAQQSFIDKTAYVIGWGRDSANSTGSKALKYATVPIIPNVKCRQYWSVNEKNICTAPGLGQDACQGDSGGPLIVMQNGQSLQVGVVSYGDAACPSSNPGVFTRVTSFLPWIQSVTKIRYKVIY